MAFLARWPERVSSALARAEVLRAVRRIRASAATRRRAHRVLRHLALIRIDERVLAMAGRVGPPDLRTLDALHLATARTLDHDLGGIVTYDGRLGGAARRSRLRVWAPS
jgi:predicted nucleic acid-binding protein